jgi:hypothetical protein
MTAKKAFPLRLDPALHEALERAAAADLRSLNAQIEVLLREALAKRGVKVAVIGLAARTATMTPMVPSTLTQRRCR